MDELIGRLVANVGVDKAAAATAVGIILQFLAKEGPADKVQQLIDTAARRGSGNRKAHQRIPVQAGCSAAASWPPAPA